MLDALDSFRRYFWRTWMYVAQRREGTREDPEKCGYLCDKRKAASGFLEHCRLQTNLLHVSFCALAAANTSPDQAEQLCMHATGSWRKQVVYDLATRFLEKWHLDELAIYFQRSELCL